MINVLNLAANAHKTFNLSKIGKKRQLINLVLLTKKLNGQKLEFTLRPPFDQFVKTAKNGEWRPSGPFSTNSQASCCHYLSTHVPPLKYYLNASLPILQNHR